MPTPDAEEFARTVLWHLAGLRAEIASLNVRIHDLQEAAGRPITTEYVQQCIERDQKSQMEHILTPARRRGSTQGLMPKPIPDTLNI
jgi:hypothetical protein